MLVRTDSGQVRGDSEGVFRGIPFAAPPEGPLRFAPPAPPESWDGVRDCTSFGSAPPQLAPAPGAPPAWRPGDGLDCLTLNVWTPDLGAAGLPVMVWIYGGQWKYGATRMPQYDAATLAASGVVVVTVNYRVGFEGFGHLPGVADNRGVRDQIAALEWVQRNIAAFGGAPGNVTVFGQSAGAASIALLLGTAAAKGLFRRAIAQSIPSGYRSTAEAEAVTAAIAAAAGVPATRDGFAALAPEAILAVQDVTEGVSSFSPVIDGDLVTGPPWSARLDPDVDLICGFTHDEYLGHGPVPNADLSAVAAAIGLPPDAATAYRAFTGDPIVAMLSDALIRMPTTWVAEAHAGGRTWLYDFTWRGPTVGAAHGIDIPFTFGNPTTRFATRFLGTPPPVSFGPLSEEIRRAWTTFATTGDPGWPQFTDHHQTRIWDTEPSVATDPLAASRAIWQDVGH
ncbi:carboxylesterase family protein [Actinocrispum sp. NPDC049592]|uniref:carboxylesterase/lipase family protein n=1 Tax=Actinocrispum sp. NPDC049592 TaxID=3154835 RepID=UPI003412847E